MHSFITFQVGAFATNTLGQSGGEKLSTLSEWFAPMDEGAHRRAKTTGNNSTMIRTSVQGRVTAPGGAMQVQDGGRFGGGKRGLKMPALKGMQVRHWKKKRSSSEPQSSVCIFRVQNNLRVCVCVCVSVCLSVCLSD